MCLSSLKENYRRKDVNFEEENFPI
jgi:hypothetical protein